MTGTELAINLGFIVTKEGRVFLRNNNKKYQAYTGKLQAYQKFGYKALADTTYYLDGDSSNVNYDNVSLLYLRDKEFNIANEIKNLSIDNLKKEIDKCIVLCANCHRKLHYYNLSIEELKRLHSVPEVA